MDPRAEGTVYPDVAFDLDAGISQGFADLFGDPATIPPTVLTAAEFAVIPTIVTDPGVGLDFSRVVHGSQEYEYRRPLVVGERLTARARLSSIRQRGDTGFLMIETELRDPDGTIVAVCRSLMIERASR